MEIFFINALRRKRVNKIMKKIISHYSKMNLLKTLSTTYLQTAKKLDYKWLDLVRKSTRDNVINDVLKYENIHKDAIRKFKIRQKQDKIIREHHKIIKKHKKMMKEQSNKQTADVLLFKIY